MKLRIKGSALRLRLTQGEVARLEAGERVEETTPLGLGSEERLAYGIETTSEAAFAVRLDGHCITVFAPDREVQRWAASDTEGLYADLSLGSETLALAVEKDFRCLTPRQEDHDAFPHPAEGEASC
jgi:hypothetical protein